MNDRDKRQLSMMLEVMADYERGARKIGELVDDLEGLLNQLENIPSSWKQTFLTYWGELEDVRAALVQEEPYLSSEQASNIISEAIANLKYMVFNLLEC